MEQTPAESQRSGEPATQFAEPRELHHEEGEPATTIGEQKADQDHFIYEPLRSDDKWIRLLKLHFQDDDLARSVQAVRTTDFPYRTGSMICSTEAFSVENFLNVLRSREFVNSKRTARFKFPFIDGDEPNEARFGLKWPLLTRIILLCCSNIQRLELFEPENDQHQGKLFVKYFWPWQLLKKVFIRTSPVLHDLEGR